jgi:hypothetical protein
MTNIDISEAQTLFAQWEVPAALGASVPLDPWSL